MNKKTESPLRKYPDRCPMSQTHTGCMPVCTCRDSVVMTLTNRNDPEEMPQVYQVMVPRCMADSPEDALELLRMAAKDRKCRLDDAMLTWHEVLVGAAGVPFSRYGIMVSPIDSVHSIALGMDDGVFSTNAEGSDDE